MQKIFKQPLNSIEPENTDLAGYFTRKVKKFYATVKNGKLDYSEGHNLMCKENLREEDLTNLRKIVTSRRREG